MRLFAYILRDFFKYFLGALMLTLFLFILFDFIHKTTRYFPRYQPAAVLVFKMYVLQLPSHILQAMPMAALLASVTSMALLSRGNELTAMQSVGMGPLRIGMPLFFGGFMLAVSGWLLNEYVIPLTAQRFHYVQEVQIEGVPSFEIADGVTWLKQKNVIYNFGKYDSESQIFRHLRMTKVTEDFLPLEAIEAATVRNLNDGGSWELTGVSVLRFDGNGGVSSQDYVPSIKMNLPIDVKKLAKERRLPSEMSRRELAFQITSTQNTGQNILPLQVDYHVKLAYPFAALVVSLLGLKFMYSSERSADTAKSILLALGIGMSFWFLLNSFMAMGRRGTVLPVVGAWGANIVLSAIAFWDIWRARVTSR